MKWRKSFVALGVTKAKLEHTYHKNIYCNYYKSLLFYYLVPVVHSDADLVMRYLIFKTCNRIPDKGHLLTVRRNYRTSKGIKTAEFKITVRVSRQCKTVHDFIKWSPVILRRRQCRALELLQRMTWVNWVDVRIYFAFVREVRAIYLLSIDFELYKLHVTMKINMLTEESSLTI